MSSHHVARRYARALYGVAQDAGQVMTVAENMATLSGILRAHPRVARYLADQRQPCAMRCAVLREMLKPGAHELVDRFCSLLAAKRRLGLLPAIAVEFAITDDAARGIARATVSAAHSLTDSAAAMIIAAIKPSGANELRLKVSVDAELLAGVRIRLGDMIYDASLAARLRQAGRRLAGAGRGDL